MVHNISNRSHIPAAPPIAHAQPLHFSFKKKSKIDEVQKKALSSKTKDNQLKKTSLFCQIHPSLAGLPDFSSRYSMVRLLGTGSSANVYLVKDKQNNNLFAGKMFIKRQGNFSQEATILNILKGFAHISQLHDVVRYGTDPVIVMEVLQQENLFFMRNLSFNEIVSILKQVLEFLVVCKEKGLVGLDLKPANLGYDPTQKRLKIYDMEVAKFRAQLSSGEQGGTFGFIAPERLFGCLYNESADIWSLACTIYELYTGTPFIPDLPAERDNMDFIGWIIYAIIDRCGMFPSKLLNAANRNIVFRYFTLDSQGEDIPKNQAWLPSWESSMRKQAARFEESRRAEKLIALLKRMFVYDPTKRISPEEALKDPLFRRDVHVKISCDRALKSNELTISYAYQKGRNKRLVTLALPTHPANLSCVHIPENVEEYIIKYKHNKRRFQQVLPLKNGDTITVP